MAKEEQVAITRGVIAENVTLGLENFKLKQLVNGLQHQVASVGFDWDKCRIDLNGHMHELANCQEQVRVVEGRNMNQARTIQDLYSQRNLLAMLAVKLAGEHGGYYIDEESPEWVVAYIELPTGQVTWHIHPNDFSILSRDLVEENKWDGHDNDEKERRVREWLRQD